MLHLIRANFLAIAMLTWFGASAQNIKEIDRIFQDWNQKNHPGGVVMVTKGNEPIFKKSFGFANMQYNVSNDLETAFNIASVSKQFTGLGIALLVEQGKISADDNIKMHLPELPDFGDRIKIRHLLHHTSGLRSTPELFGIAGWREGDAIYTEDVYNYLCKQKDLNFEPGEEFMYSNSNYVLLALIIQKVSGEEFSSWMNSNVFMPLNMKSTYVDALNEKTAGNTSTPYFEKEENVFICAENTGLEIGASNVYSTAPDLQKWLNQLKSPDKKWASAIDFMLTTKALNSGTPNEYANGLFVDTYKGNKRIYHEGGILGYVSFCMYFPDEQLSVIVLCNYLDYRAHQRVDGLLSLLLEDKTVKNQASEEIAVTPLHEDLAKSVCGSYWNWNDSYLRTVQMESDTLWYVRTNGAKSPLFQIEDSTFVIGGIKAVVKVRFGNKDGKLVMHVQDGDKPEQHLEYFDNTAPTAEELTSYCGSFYSAELETTYSIQAANGGIIGYHSRHGSFEIQSIGKDFVNWSGFANAKYVYDEKGHVLGFHLTTTRIRNILFAKQPEVVGQ